MARELLQPLTSVKTEGVMSAAYIPDNEEINSDHQIDNTGIVTRYRFDGEREKAIATMGSTAVQDVLKRKKWHPAEINRLLVSTSIPYGHSPSEQIAELTSAENANLGDYYAACASFLAALDDLYKNPPEDGAKVIIVASEQYSTVRKLHDSIFGDGSSALTWEWNIDMAIRASTLQIVFDQEGIIKMPINEALYPPEPPTRFRIPFPYSENYVEMKGGTILEWINGDRDISFNGKTLLRPIEILSQTCDETGINLSSLDYLIPHQSSGIAVDILYRQAKEAGFRGRFIKTVQDYGNTSSDTIPRAFHIANQEEPFKPGTKVGLVSFSAGFVVASSIVEILR